MRFPADSKTGNNLTQAQAASWARTNGGNRRPQPPRNPQAQGGSRKVLVTWDMPFVSDDIIGWRIYKDNENSMLDSIYDPNVRQYTVQATAGATPPTINVFISSLSKRSESSKVQVQGAALAESGAPTDPAPPPGSAASGDTGKKVGIDGAGTNDSGFTR